MSHRFTRDLTEGGLDDLLADFFGFDGGAQIGLELRYGLMRGWQVGIYRTSDRTIELFTQYNVLRQGGEDALHRRRAGDPRGHQQPEQRGRHQPTGEGVRSPALGTVVSWVLGRTASVNATFAWVNNTNPLPSDLVDHNDTYILGIGGRLRVRPTVYVVAEVVPRIGGDTPNSTLASFGIEKRVGGHAFQVNFSNGIGSTHGADRARRRVGPVVHRLQHQPQVLLSAWPPVERSQRSAVKDSHERRGSSIALGVLAAAFVVMQGLAPERTNPATDPSLRLEAQATVPDHVAATLRRACYDCHSHETRWPWYARVAPVSWLVVRDVDAGRGQMNLSRWGEYNEYDRADMLDEACTLVRASKMPLRPYRMMHGEARLSPQDIAAICAWTRREAARLPGAGAPQ